MSKSYNTILVKQKDFGTTICLNRPEKHNAFNAEMIEELTHAVKEQSTNQHNRYLLFIGEGKSFSAGADLAYMKSMAKFSQQENKEDAERLYDLFASIYNCAIPTICYVQNASFGGANGIIATCDYAIANENTNFSFSEVKLGIVPATISPFVIEKIGTANASDLFLSGRRFNAQQAQNVGLVQQLVIDDEKDEAIANYINHFVTAAPEAVKQTKQLIRQLHQQENKKEFTANLIAKARTSNEGQEGITAFFDKRKPNWASKQSK